jgi:hypothetical protein
MNNIDIYNAVISGLAGSTQNFTSQTPSADFTRFGDRSVILASAVDAQIAPSTITQAEAVLMAQVVAGIDLNRSLLGVTPNFTSMANDIVKLWTQFRGRIIPAPSGGIAIEVLNVAELRALPFNPLLVFLQRYAGVGTEKSSGWFSYMPGAVNPDDGGVWFVNVVGGRYRRDKSDCGYVNAFWFGGVGDYDPSTNAGGAYDDTALEAANNYANANKLSLYVPATDKTWLITSKRIHIDTDNVLYGDGWQKTIIVTKITAGIYIGKGAYASDITSLCYNWALRDFSIVYYGGDDAAPAPIQCLIDIVASAHAKIIEVGVGGRVERCINSARTAPWPGDVRGENYFLETKLRTSRPIFGLVYPKRYDVMFYNHGALNGSTIKGHCQIPLVGGAFLGGEPGEENSVGFGHDIRIVDFHVESNDTPGTIGIRMIAMSATTIDHVYGEGIITVVSANGCNLLGITNTYGGKNIFTNCRGITLGPNYNSNEFYGCRGIVETAGASYSPEPRAIYSDNLSVVTLGCNQEPGVADLNPIVGSTPSDVINIAANGNFVRWLSATTPWGWVAQPGYTLKFTKCGTGLADTTRTCDSVYCARLVTDTACYLPITKALGSQFLNTVISFSIKVKVNAGYAAAMAVPGLSTDVFASRSLTVDNTWIDCDDENNTVGNDWRVCQFSYLITQDMIEHGISLKLISNALADVYIADIQATFGTCVSRRFIPASITHGGQVIISQDGSISQVSAVQPGNTDAFFGQTFLQHDYVYSTASAETGWVRGPAGNWITTYVDETSSYIAKIIRISNGKLSRVNIGEDLGDIGSNIPSWYSRVGANAALASTGQPVVGTIRGRKAAIFSAGADSQALTFAGSLAEYWAVARYDGPLPFPDFIGIIAGATTGAVGVRLYGFSGLNTLAAGAYTIEKNGIADSTMPAAITTIWRAYGAAGVDDRWIGGFSVVAAQNFRGAIGLGLGFSAALTTEEAEGILAVTKEYYSK